MAAGSELGRKADDIMRRGELVPDEIVIGLIAERLDAGLSSGNHPPAKPGAFGM